MIIHIWLWAWPRRARRADYVRWRSSRCGWRWQQGPGTYRSWQLGWLCLSVATGKRGFALLIGQDPLR